jgi:tRNA1(Val) A37 N6-methylase TrmN6
MALPAIDLNDPVLGRLTDDRITRDFRVFQRAEGHRFSSDDMATAYVAWRAAPQAKHILDLGCGLGSVLLQLAWTRREARLVGVEVQDGSFELLRRNVERNGLTERVALVHGDLRDASTLSRIPRPESGFELITGTPPYFPPDTATDSLDEQRAYARIEYRGGVEAYLITAARLLGPEGTVVLCGDAKADARVTHAAAPLGLHLHARCEIVAHEGRPPLFSVWTLARTPKPMTASSLTLRTVSGARTADADTLRAFSGFDRLLAAEG